MRTSATLVFLLVVLASGPGPQASISQPLAVQQNSIEQLEAKLKSQYKTIQTIIASPPSSRGDRGRLVREWQDDMAQSFKRAATTIVEIISLNPPNRDMWQERLDTVRLYSQPVSSPDLRQVYGSGEVQKSVKILETPLAVYTDEARAAKTNGDVRLRLVFAADGTVKNVFPIKSLDHGLTESAMDAARRIKFEPAVRNGKPASQFATLVYEFEKSGPRKPYIPKTVF